MDYKVSKEFADKEKALILNRSICDGIKFDTITYAAIHFGMTVEGIRYRLLSNKYENWNYIEKSEG